MNTRRCVRALRSFVEMSVDRWREVGTTVDTFGVTWTVTSRWR